MRGGAASLALVLALGAAAVAARAEGAATDAGEAASDEAGLVAQTELEVGPPGKRITRVEVDNPLGDVRVIGHDKAGLRITAVKRAPDQAALGRLRVSLTPDAAGPMRIVTAVDGGREAKAVRRAQVRIDLVIEAPRDAWVDGRTGDGTLELINMDAGGELDAASGAIVVRNVEGPVTAHTVDAALTMSEVFGIVEAGALAGDVKLDSIRGDRLVATAHAGRIELRRVRSKQIELTTTSGAIAIEGHAVAGGTLRISSTRGDVSVRLRGAVAVRAFAPTVTLVGARVTTDAAGWRAAAYGEARTAAAVELVSRHGAVVFASVAPGSPSK